MLGQPARLTDANFVDEKLAEHFANIVLECNAHGEDPASALICLLLEHKAALILNMPDANDDTIANLCSKPAELVAHGYAGRYREQGVRGINPGK